MEIKNKSKMATKKFLKICQVLWVSWEVAANASLFTSARSKPETKLTSKRTKKCLKNFIETKFKFVDK